MVKSVRIATSLFSVMTPNSSVSRPSAQRRDHVHLPEAVRGVDVALNVGDRVQIRTVDVRDADRVVDHLDTGGQVRQGDRLEAAGQRLVHTLHQLVDRDRTVAGQVERRARGHLRRAEGDVHALDQVVDGDPLVPGAVAQAGDGGGASDGRLCDQPDRDRQNNES